MLTVRGAALSGIAAENLEGGSGIQSRTIAMAVRLDDGRGVAFDTKDYAHVDHGYAATIHKSQGVTVDQAYVLATPGMDRHAAYVALSRHRDGVQLHYPPHYKITSAELEWLTERVELLQQLVKNACKIRLATSALPAPR